VLVQPGDHRALAGAIARLIDAPEEAERMGAAAQERRRSEFSIDAVVRRVEALYLDLLNPRPPSRGSDPL